MVTLTFVAHDGTERMVEAAAGASIMAAAIANDVPGIDADCGGACACATCHVYVADEWIGRVGEPNDDECEMLALANAVRPTSRLSCQIRLGEALDGLVVETPESQQG